MGISEAVYFISAVAIEPFDIGLLEEDRLSIEGKTTGDSLTLPMQGGLICSVQHRD